MIEPHNENKLKQMNKQPIGPKRRKMLEQDKTRHGHFVTTKRAVPRT
jgi:hypothetical protein